MPMHYSDPTRTEQAHALPDVETFRAALLACDECGTDTIIPTDRSTYADCPTCGETGVTNNVAWYWRPCFPGCLPDGDPVGPFDSEADALADARERALLPTT